MEYEESRIITKINNNIKSGAGEGNAYQSVSIFSRDYDYAFLEWMGHSRKIKEEIR